MAVDEAMYLPGTQLTQLADPVAVWYIPVGHWLHALAPANEYRPAAHTDAQIDVAPEVLKYLPASQGAQLPAAMYDPAGHAAVQALEPNPENNPTAHIPQLDSPVDEPSNPDEQVTQLVLPEAD